MRLYTHTHGHIWFSQTYLCSFKSSSNCEIFVTIFRCSFRKEFNSFRILACSLSFFDDSPAILWILFAYCSYSNDCFFLFASFANVNFMYRKNNNDQRAQQQQQTSIHEKWNTEHTIREVFSLPNRRSSAFLIIWRCLLCLNHTQTCTLRKVCTARKCQIISPNVIWFVKRRSIRNEIRMKNSEFAMYTEFDVFFS